MAKSPVGSVLHVCVTLISRSVNSPFSLHKGVVRCEKINDYQFFVKLPKRLEFAVPLQCLADSAL